MKKDKNIIKLFSKEIEVLNRSNKMIKEKNISKESLISEYELLNNQYCKLLKEILALTKLSDSTQKQLIVTNEHIQKQKDSLMSAYKVIKIKSEELIESYNLLKEISRNDSLIKLLNHPELMEKLIYEIEYRKRNKNKTSFEKTKKSNVGNKKNKKT